MDDEDEKTWGQERHPTKGETIVVIGILVILFGVFVIIVTGQWGNTTDKNKCRKLCHPYQSMVEMKSCYCATEEDWKFKETFK